MLLVRQQREALVLGIRCQEKHLEVVIEELLQIGQHEVSEVLQVFDLRVLVLRHDHVEQNVAVDARIVLLARLFVVLLPIFHDEVAQQQFALLDADIESWVLIFTVLGSGRLQRLHADEAAFGLAGAAFTARSDE